MKSVKKFRLSYAELAQRGDRVETVVRRDATQFAEYGYTDGLPDEVATKTQEFKALESDMYWEGQKTLATDNKNFCRAKVTQDIEEIGFKSKLALGENSKEYRMFRISGMKNLNDKELVVYGRHVCITAKTFLDKLTTRNITEENIQKAEANVQNLDDAIDTQLAAIGKREQKSIERLEKGNELYELIAELCEVGRRIWEGKNEAFYQDYVLYGSNRSNEEEENKSEPNAEESLAGK
jgi:hypothetical protein